MSKFRKAARLVLELNIGLNLRSSFLINGSIQVLYYRPIREKEANDLLSFNILPIAIDQNFLNSVTSIADISRKPIIVEFTSLVAIHFDFSCHETVPFYLCDRQHSLNRMLHHWHDEWQTKQPY